MYVKMHKKESINLRHFSVVGFETEKERKEFEKKTKELGYGVVTGKQADFLNSHNKYLAMGAADNELRLEAFLFELSIAAEHDFEQELGVQIIDSGYDFEINVMTDGDKDQIEELEKRAIRSDLFWFIKNDFN